MEHNQNTITNHQRVIQIKFHDHSWLFHRLLKKLTFVKRLFWQLGTCFSGHCCCREVTVTERFKQEAIYGLSAGTKIMWPLLEVPLYCLYKLHHFLCTTTISLHMLRQVNPLNPIIHIQILSGM